MNPPHTKNESDLIASALTIVFYNECLDTRDYYAVSLLSKAVHQGCHIANAPALQTTMEEHTLARELKEAYHYAIFHPEHTLTEEEKSRPYYKKCRKAGTKDIGYYVDYCHIFRPCCALGFINTSNYTPIVPIRQPNRISCQVTCFCRPFVGITV